MKGDIDRLKQDYQTYGEEKKKLLREQRQKVSNLTPTLPKLKALEEKFNNLNTTNANFKRIFLGQVSNQSNNDENKMQRFYDAQKSQLKIFQDLKMALREIVLLHQGKMFLCFKK